MYDLIYLENEDDFVKAQADVKQRFPEACIEDASDFVHSYRFSVEVDVPTKEYCLALLDLGLAAYHSLHFGLLMRTDITQAKALVEEWKIETKEDQIVIEHYCPHCKSPLIYTGATSAGEVLLYCAQCNKQIEFSDVEEDKFSTKTKEESDNETS